MTATATNRSTLREILSLAWPIVLAQLGLPLMGLVDSAIVGRVSVEDLAGAALGRTIGFLGFTPMIGLAMGLEPLASQSIGAKEPARAWGALKTTMRTVLLVWAPLMMVSFGITCALGSFGVEPEVATRARAYFLGQAPGFLLAGAFLATRTFLAAHGITRPALVAVVLANLSNLVVCNLLVRGDDALASVGMHGIGLPRLGAFGAGLASTLADVILLGVVARAAWLIRPSAAERGAAAPVSAKTVLKIGSPVAGQLLAEMGAFNVAALVAGSMGKVIISSHQIALGMASVTYMGAAGISGATAVLVGRAVGAGTSPRRTGMVGIAIGAVMMAVPALAFAIVPRQLASLFTHDPAVLDLCAILLRIAGVFQLFDGAQAVAGGALRGAGDVKSSFVVNVMAHWGVGLPCALVFAFLLRGGASGLWWGLTLGLVVGAVLLIWRFLVLTRGTIQRVAVE